MGNLEYMKKILWLLILLFVLPNVIAMEGHVKLLAVKEKDDGSFEGSTADLFLEVRKGSGRVFLDTFPLTKTDTQISMRFAKEVSCKFIGKDCSKYDFIYTIRADAPIIAGPSAGAAAADKKPEPPKDPFALGDDGLTDIERALGGL